LKAVVQTIFYYGPIWFGLGFLAPLISQSIQAFGWTPPFDLAPLYVGLIIGGTYAIIAQVWRRWI